MMYFYMSFFWVFRGESGKFIYFWKFVIGVGNVFFFFEKKKKEKQNEALKKIAHNLNEFWRKKYKLFNN